MSSINETLENVRKPRVHIKYEVETEGATEEKTLPFVVGVIGDFSGDSPLGEKSLKERSFIEINRDNFDDIMNRLQPGVNISVPNTLKNDNTEMKLCLSFKKLADFDPGHVAQQVPALKTLLATRNKLRDLLTKADRSAKLESILEQCLQDRSALLKLAKALNIDTDNNE